jgi:hypothetical protein
MFKHFCVASIIYCLYGKYTNVMAVPSAGITWNKTLEYVFDVSTHCANKCLSNNLINITWDSNIVDYYSTLQTALTKIQTLGEGALMLSDGTYMISSNLIMNSNTCLMGQSKEKTIIKLMNLASPFKYAGTVRCLDAVNITLSDLTIDGNRVNQKQDIQTSYGRYGFFSQTSDYVFLNKVKIINNYGYGFDPHGDKINWANFLAIVDCESYNNGFDGFALDQTYFITFNNNTASNNDRHGVNIITGSKFAQITNNNLSKNGVISQVGCGITVQNNDNFNTSNINIENNNLVDNFSDSLCINNVSKVYIDTNDISIITNTLSYCLLVQNSTDITFTNNHCNANNFINNKTNINFVQSLNTFIKNTLPPVPINKTLADPYCDSGIINMNICCVGKCSQCGGPNCSLDPLGATNCCSTTIATQVNYCNETAPPCIIVNPPRPIIRNDTNPDPTCTLGIINKKICCKKGCASCGGGSCSLDPLGSDNCCSAGITKAGYYCDKYSAPCIIGKTPSTIVPAVAPTITPTLTPTMISPTVLTVVPVISKNKTNVSSNNTSNSTISSTMSPTMSPTMLPTLSTLSPLMAPAMPSTVSPTFAPTFAPTLSPGSLTTSPPTVPASGATSGTTSGATRFVHSFRHLLALIPLAGYILL